MTEEEKFIQRLTNLRLQKNISAREMSLSIGQCAGYINNIENGNNLPSMMGFFYICEYLKITPKEFFDYENDSSSLTNELITEIKKLDYKQTEHILAVIKDINKKH